jgi:hypothetical protein
VEVRLEARAAPFSPPSARALVLEASVVVLLAATVTIWFAVSAGASLVLVPLAALAIVTAVRLRTDKPSPSGWPSVRPPRAETLACSALAVLYRLSALRHPSGFVNRDGAYGGFIAMHLMGGARPAPIFTEGANYQGSLKGHLAALLALLTGSRDFAWLMLLASMLLYLVFLAASMTLARRLGGRPAALVTGLYLALSPKFLTTFSLNCVGQYTDVLALGGLSLALLGSLLDDDRRGASARGSYFAVGWLLGVAFWQQPVALAYVGAAAAALAFRRRSARDPWVLLMPMGLAVGALPVLLWNIQNHWASSGILGRDPGELRAQAEALPTLAVQTLLVALPVLVGQSPGHPWSSVPGLSILAIVGLPLLLGVFMVLRGHDLWSRLKTGTLGAAWLPLLLTAANLGLYWATAAGSINRRPRYLLPVLAAAALELGVVGAWISARSRLAAAGGMALVLAFNVAGTWPRLGQAEPVEAFWREIVRSLEEKRIRTGYADFAIAAPVTLFTAERITLSARLGPTPAYYSDLQDERVAREGPDAFVLAPGDHAEALAAQLRSMGVTYRVAREPVVVFWGFSRQLRLDEVSGFRGGGSGAVTEEE